jgi:hypothetical protein
VEAAAVGGHALIIASPAACQPAPTSSVPFHVGPR